MESISSLLKEISKISSANDDPTLFDMMGNGSSETIHSAIVGFLLNPNAHEGGVDCLKEFVKMLPKDKLGNFNTDAIRIVELEKDLGPVNIDSYPTGGRIDIFVEDHNGHSLVIENKIYASDGECQLLRYHNSLQDKPHTLIYLTLFGNRPSDKSLGRGTKIVSKALDPDLVISISYAQIDQWLSSIIGFCSLSIASNIVQYQDLIKRLMIIERISQCILASGENYAAAIKIVDSLEFARMNLKKEFMAQLKDVITEMLAESYTICDYNTSDNGKIIGLILRSKSSDLICELLIDWRLYLSCNQSHPRILQYRHKHEQKSNTWDYIGNDKNDYNFHDGSAFVREYLSGNSDKKQEFVTNVAKRVAELIKRIEEDK